MNVIYVAPAQFMMGAYTVPVAIDRGAAVAGKFGILSGVVLIDRVGKIVYTGAMSGSSHQELVQALQEVGVW